MSRNLIIAAVVLVVLIGGVVLIMGNQGQSGSATPTPTQAMEEEDSDEEAMEEKSEDAEDEEAKPDEEEAMEEEESIDIKNFAFAPKTLTVKVGTTVTWTNQDSVGHTATSDDGSFDTGLLAKGESGSVTFNEKGTFTYHCTPHPYMKAKIVVE